MKKYNYLFLSPNKKEAFKILSQIENKGFADMLDLKHLAYLGFPIYEAIEHRNFELISFLNLHRSLEKYSRLPQFSKIKDKYDKKVKVEETFNFLISSVLNLKYVKLFLKYVK